MFVSHNLLYYTTLLKAVINAFISKVPDVTFTLNIASVVELASTEKEVPVAAPVVMVCSSFTTELPFLSQLPNTVPTFLLASEESVKA